MNVELGPLLGGEHHLLWPHLVFDWGNVLCDLDELTKHRVALAHRVHASKTEIAVRGIPRTPWGVQDPGRPGPAIPLMAYTRRRSRPWQNL